MKKLHQMAIEEIEELLSNVTDPSSASPAEAVLQSKSIRFLSSEIAVFKEALCLESRQLQKSNEELAKSQDKYQRATIILTVVIAVGTVAQVFSPQIQAIISWSLKFMK